MIFNRIAVGQHPFAVGRVGAMPVARKHIFGDNFRPVRFVCVKVILKSPRVTLGEIDDLLRIYPGVVRTHFFQIQRPDFDPLISAVNIWVTCRGEPSAAHIRQRWKKAIRLLSELNNR